MQDKSYNMNTFAGNRDDPEQKFLLIKYDH